MRISHLRTSQFPWVLLSQSPRVLLFIERGRITFGRVTLAIIHPYGSLCSLRYIHDKISNSFAVGDHNKTPGQAMCSIPKSKDGGTYRFWGTEQTLTPPSPPERSDLSPGSTDCHQVVMVIRVGYQSSCHVPRHQTGSKCCPLVCARRLVRGRSASTWGSSCLRANPSNRPTSLRRVAIWRTAQR